MKLFSLPALFLPAAALAAFATAAPTPAPVPAGPAPAAAQTDGNAVERYVFDRTHTYVGFSARHMLVTKVRGQFGDFEGTIDFDPENVENSKVDVTVQVTSVDTKNQRRDDHLRTSDFFDAGTWPTITFRGTGVERDGEQLVLVGDLTIKDVTKQVRIPFELTGPVQTGPDQKRLGASGEVVINRFDYGVAWDRTTEAGGLVVGEDVTLVLEVAAVHEG